VQEFKKGNNTGKVNWGISINNTYISIVYYHPEMELTGMHYHEIPSFVVWLQTL